MRRSVILVPVALFAAVATACGPGGALPLLPSAAGGANKRSAAAADSIEGSFAPAFRVTYVLGDNVKEPPMTGAAYRLTSTPTKASVAKLAKAFGVTGAVTTDEFGWMAGSDDHQLRVEKNAGQRFSLYASKGGGVSSCAVAVEPTGPAPDQPNADAGGDGAKTGNTLIAPVPSEPPSDAPADKPGWSTEPCKEPEPVEGLPTNAEALAEATRVFGDGGVAQPEGKPSIQRNFDSVSVQYAPEVDGLTADGMDMFISFGPERAVLYASGFTSAPKQVGDYRLAGIKRAVERLNEMNANIEPASCDGTTPCALYDGSSRDLPARDLPAGDPAPADDAATDLAPADRPVPNEERKVVLTSVESGLQYVVDGDNEAWLTPSYRFSNKDGEQVTAEAAADDLLRKPDTTATTAPPTADTKPGSGSGGGSTGSTGGGSTGGSASGDCSTVTPTSPDPANQSISVTVCLDQAKFAAGEPVMFHVTASDPDRAFSDVCGSDVNALYGDDGPGEVRCMACASSVAEGPGKLGTDRAHTYAKPGSYTAVFTVRSGAFCGEANPHDSTAEIKVPVIIT